MQSLRKREETINENWMESFERITVIRTWDTNEIHVSLFRRGTIKYDMRRIESKRIPAIFNYDYSWNVSLNWKGGIFNDLHEEDD